MVLLSNFPKPGIQQTHFELQRHALFKDCEGYFPPLYHIRCWWMPKFQEAHKKIHMHWPGIEPGSPAWEARILPLNHQCLDLLQGTRSPQEVAQEGRFLFVCLFVFGNRPLRLRGREKLKKKKKKSTRLVRHSLLVILDINFCARRMREYVQRS